MKSVDEIVPLTDLFFEDFPELTEAERRSLAGRNSTCCSRSLQSKTEVRQMMNLLQKTSSHKSKQSKRNGYQRKNLFMPIRIAVSGEMYGPELPDTIFLLDVKNQSSILKTC